MIYLGIDPGLSGGLAAVDDQGAVVFAVKMPVTERDLLEALQPCAALDGPRARAVLEKVHTMPKQGIVSAFTFGRGYGGLRMALTATRIPFDEVTPQKWQLVMGCRTHGEKNISKRRAQQLFPSVSVTHALADALLLAEFCRRCHVRVERSA